MNKFQKKLNATTKKYIESYKEEFLESNPFPIVNRQCGKTNMLIARVEKLLEELSILDSKSYYRWVRGMIKEQVKVGFKL